MIHHVDRLTKKNHTLTLTGAEKALDKDPVAINDNDSAQTRNIGELSKPSKEQPQKPGTSRHTTVREWTPSPQVWGEAGMSALTRSASQCNKARKRNKRNTY